MSEMKGDLLLSILIANRDSGVVVDAKVNKQIDGHEALIIILTLEEQIRNIKANFEATGVRQ